MQRLLALCRMARLLLMHLFLVTMLKSSHLNIALSRATTFLKLRHLF
jgi:hypothetical protein